jgi:leucyl aminopeptidase
MVDLATLTGAIIVSLGSEYAGLFSNDDKLSNQLIKAGDEVDEKLWRMPLHKNFDKLIDSKNADMQNINYVGGAGSTTAAQFLQRFVLNKTPWAHLRYSWNGLFEIWRSIKFRWCNRLRCKIIK